MVRGVACLARCMSSRSYDKELDVTEVDMLEPIYRGLMGCLHATYPERKD